MTTVRHILDAKGHQVYSVQSTDKVADALRLMADKNVGAVLVIDDERVTGIFTERHYARNVFLKGRTSPTTLVREVMAKDVIYVEPEHTVESCMALMTAKGHPAPASPEWRQAVRHHFHRRPDEKRDRGPGVQHRATRAVRRRHQRLSLRYLGLPAMPSAGPLK